MDPTKFHGFITVNKPSGWTSRDVVNRLTYLVRRVVGQSVKTGHCGTLDPMATGVLVVAVGYATRLVSHVQTQKKSYLARFILGTSTNTDDVTGKVTGVSNLDDFEISEGSIESLLPSFRGQVEQVPPAFSAVKIDGKRAYKLARKGEEVEVQPRTVQIDKLELTQFSLPEFELEIDCGAGTYVRSIGRDLGALLKCGATMKSLVRTRVGVFDLADSTDLDDINEETLLPLMTSTQNAVPGLSRIQLTADELKSVRNGRPISTGDWFAKLFPSTKRELSTDERRQSMGSAVNQELPREDVVLENSDGDFVALARMDEHIIRCLIVFPDLAGRLK
jgi:tRNA pseudouridine55 synthase